MATECRNKFSLRLRELRLAHGYSQREFAEKLDIKYHTYYKYERGEAVPSFDALLDIADKCNVSLDWLCARTVISRPASDKNDVATVLNKLLLANELGSQIEVKISFDGVKTKSSNEK